MNLTTSLPQNSTPLAMTSRELAKLTGKRHCNVTADIKKMLAALTSSRDMAAVTGKQHFHVKRDIAKMLDACGEDCTLSKYTDSMNRPQVEYLLTPKMSALLMAKYQGLARVPHRLQEEAALKTIEQLLGIQLIRQFAVLTYRVDGYDPERNVAYEIDEPEHKGKESEDAARQQEIAEVLGCTFVRIKL